MGWLPGSTELRVGRGFRHTIRAGMVVASEVCAPLATVELSNGIASTLSFPLGRCVRVFQFDSCECGTLRILQDRKATNTRDISRRFHYAASQVFCFLDLRITVVNGEI